MHINIDGLRAAILTVGLVLYYFVRKHTVDRLSGSARKGDVVGAICACRCSDHALGAARRRGQHRT
ncbi:hypothetical protein ACFV27_38690 [Streptomyces antimycoticus]|uniref:hypothetical protein n=1 Tax=Streptomyces TaxID=1883 RepID=UPI0036C7690A